MAVAGWRCGLLAGWRCGLLAGAGWRCGLTVLDVSMLTAPWPSKALLSLYVV